MVKKKGGGKKKAKKKSKSPARARPPPGVYVPPRPETPPPPRNRQLPAEVKVAAMTGNTERVKEWYEDDCGHLDARAPDDGRTCLMGACLATDELTAAYLLACGADPNVQDADGETALSLAGKARQRCGFGRSDRIDRIVLNLLRSGASLTLVNREGKSAGWSVNPSLVGRHNGSAASMAPLDAAGAAARARLVPDVPGDPRRLVMLPPKPPPKPAARDAAPRAAASYLNRGKPVAAG